MSRSNENKESSELKGPIRFLKVLTVVLLVVLFVVADQDLSKEDHCWFTLGMFFLGFFTLFIKIGPRIPWFKRYYEIAEEDRKRKGYRSRRSGKAP